MGSFNETCALSNLNIPYGTPVRLLFLTQNPYVVSDGHEAKRGCYHHDNWFCRTPPLTGKYDDYGRAKLQKSPLVKLIADVFSTDVIERPFGFNQYHDPPVRRGEKLDHYLAAAWEGRLLVQDDYTKPRGQPPETWPTWDRVLAVLKRSKLPIQTDESKAGFNAQPVRPGVVCVDFNSYEDTTDKLAQAEKVLTKHYDCRVVKKFQDRTGESCLMVVPKGAFDEPFLLVERDKIEYDLATHPEITRLHRYRALPVLAVMVREDVWQHFANIEIPSNGWDRGGEKLDVESLKAKLEKEYDRLVKAKARFQSGSMDDIREIFTTLGNENFRETLHSLPFQTMPASHLKFAVESDFKAKDDLLQACAELAHVEIVMSRLHRPWYIPPLGGQESEWELHTQLLEGITAIARKQHEKEKKSTASEKLVYLLM